MVWLFFLSNSRKPLSSVGQGAKSHQKELEGFACVWVSIYCSILYYCRAMSIFIKTDNTFLCFSYLIVKVSMNLGLANLKRCGKTLKNVESCRGWEC